MDHDVRPAFDPLLYPRRLLRMKFVLKRRRITRLDTHPAKQVQGRFYGVYRGIGLWQQAVIDLCILVMLHADPSSYRQAREDETGWPAMQADDRVKSV